MLLKLKIYKFANFFWTWNYAQMGSLPKLPLQRQIKFVLEKEFIWRCVFYRNPNKTSILFTQR